MPEQQLSNQDDTQTTSPVQQQKPYAALPSTKTEEPISVNKEGYRIDTYIPSPSTEEWAAYSRRIKQHKLCNSYHLAGECGNLSCGFDHSHADDTSLRVIQYIMRQRPCRNGGTCRWSKCYMGHHCQKDGCTGSKGCYFNQQAHGVDLKVNKWLMPFDGDTSDAESYSSAEGSDQLVGRAFS